MAIFRYTGWNGIEEVKDFMGCACEAEAVARERCLLTNSGDYAFRRRRSDDRTSVAEISSRCESFPTVADEEGKDPEMSRRAALRCGGFRSEI